VGFRVCLRRSGIGSRAREALLLTVLLTFSPSIDAACWCRYLPARFPLDGTPVACHMQSFEAASLQDILHDLSTEQA